MLIRLLLPLLFATSCQPNTCTKGFTLGEDGLCYQEQQDGSRAPEVLLPNQLPDCEPVAGDGRLDLLAACMDGICIGDTVEEANAVWGEPTLCTIYQCFWRNGISAGREDSTILNLEVEAPWDGSTASGITLGLSFLCFYEELGFPDNAWYVLGKDDLYHPDYLIWLAEGVTAYTDILSEPDDYVDIIYLQGPQ